MRRIAVIVYFTVTVEAVGIGWDKK